MTQFFTSIYTGIVRRPESREILAIGLNNAVRIFYVAIVDEAENYNYNVLCWTYTLHITWPYAFSIVWWIQSKRAYNLEAA